MNQVAYWVVALFAVLQFFTGLSMKGFWAWIFRFSLAVVLWSAGWFVIAKLHNMLSSETWLAGNFAWTQGVEILSGLTQLVSVLGQDSSASYFEKIATAFQQAHQAIIWHQPDLGDLGHLNMVLFITICLSTGDASPQAQTQPAAKEQSHAPRLSHAAEQPAGSELPDQTIPSGPVNYRDYVDPYSVRSLAVSLVSGFPEHGTGPLLRAATLFEYVKNNVTYVPDPIRMESQKMVQGDLITAPAETLRIRGGDCDDQAILMASLLSAVGIANRMHLVKSQDGGWHLLTEFAVDASIHDEIVSTLDLFYASIDRETGSRGYWFFKEDPLVWLLADTTRNYVPDYAELIQSGFMVKNPDNSIHWHHLDSTY
jgi:hypothetical protein